MPRSRRTLALVALTPLVAAATAFAVTPKPGQYAISGFGEGGGGFMLKAGKLRNATAPSKFKCNRFNAVVPVAIPVKAGKFYYHGKMKGQAGTLTFAGHWVSAGKVSGTATVVKGSCRSKVSYTATPLPAY